MKQIDNSTRPDQPSANRKCSTNCNTKYDKHDGATENDTQKAHTKNTTDPKGSHNARLLRLQSNATSSSQDLEPEYLWLERDLHRLLLCSRSPLS